MEEGKERGKARRGRMMMYVFHFFMQCQVPSGAVSARVMCVCVDS